MIEKLIYNCLHCQHKFIGRNGVDGRRCPVCNGHIVPTMKLGHKLDYNEIGLIAVDKETQEVFKVTAIFYPLGKPSGKDITIEVEKDLDEWRSIDEVDIHHIG